MTSRFKSRRLEGPTTMKTNNGYGAKIKTKANENKRIILGIVLSTGILFLGLALVFYAWKRHQKKNSRPLELIAESTTEICNLTEVLRVIQLGLLCVQERPEDRPSISYVVLMLGNEDELPQPKQPENGIPMLLFSSALLLIITISIAADTINTTQSIGHRETMVAASGSIKLRSFSPGSSKNRCLDLLYTNISIMTVVWVAKREIPSAILQV
ncbi:hypothetical protein DKX38_017831 [Salix brachista]|uniref:S-locus receptor kinase C-terminal domain-containing protein n=1 Tax=Salix brachista TaxID=2182728 RepID=A0A5N5KW93_9ROSI|nr:hypothetical protein DKX38_017831 [Salix brachista]